ncbi:MAG: glycosyltransferase family 87 protein [Candidatus Methanomethylophilaceae archaeon]|nr:glycosyltransferase family 87 protein [Candidatus Methanomethylophilaceae archaeon]
MSAPLPRVKEYFLERYREDPLFFLFLSLSSVIFCVVLFFFIVTEGNTLRNMLFEDHAETFMDFFNSVMYSYDRPYTEWHVIYPPLITVFYGVLGNYMIPYVDPIPGMDLAHIIRSSQMGLMIYLAITSATLFIFFGVIRRHFSSIKNAKLITWLLACIMVSYPIVYTVERGNSILLTVLALYLFLLTYRSECVWIRRFSYLCLACAAGIKIWPLIFGILVLKERDPRDIVECMVIGAVALLLPFVFTDGTFLDLLNNISNHMSDTVANGSMISLSDISYVVFSQFLSHDVSMSCSKVCVTILTVLSLSIVLFSRNLETWKVVSILSCNLIVGFGVATPYLFIYTILPLLFFLLSEREISGMNIMYTISFVAILSMYADFGETEYLISVKTIFVFIILFGCLYSGLKDMRSSMTHEGHRSSGKV